MNAVGAPAAIGTVATVGAVGFRFVPYHQLEAAEHDLDPVSGRASGIAHVVVDGGPIASTALTLSHWPGSPTPIDLLDDLSAQIVARALRVPGLLDGLEVVTNNHFDQDGLASAFLLVDPESATARQGRVIDLARAGDFGTYVDRDSIRLAFVLAAWDDPTRSPLDPALYVGSYAETCGHLYTELLPRMPELLDGVDALRPWWEDEDAHLAESLAAIERGVVTIDERADLDLAVVRVPDGWADRMTTRFTVARSDALHPAAVNGATDRMRVAVLQGERQRLECRYETWVLFRSRPVSARPDLRPLVGRLQELEPGTATWRADAPRALTPTVQVVAGTSELGPDRFLAAVEHHLATAPGAWDPEHPSW